MLAIVVDMASKVVTASATRAGTCGKKIHQPFREKSVLMYKCSQVSVNILYGNSTIPLYSPARRRTRTPPQS